MKTYHSYIVQGLSKEKKYASPPVWVGEAKFHKRKGYTQPHAIKQMAFKCQGFLKK